MAPPVRNLQDWRNVFLRECYSEGGDGVQAATFQPNPERESEDRYVIQDWYIAGRSFRLMAVFDGHVGPWTAEYVSVELPKRIKTGLRDHLPELVDEDRNVVTERVNTIIRESFEGLDQELGDAVRQLCEDPASLSDEEAQSIVDLNSDVLKRAYGGTTVALALFDDENNDLWLAGVGDSTAALVFPNEGKRMLKHHGTKRSEADPKDYTQVIADHFGERNIMKDHKLIGAVAVFRAIGDFALKLPVAYSTTLFFRLPNRPSEANYRMNVEENNLKPPYMTATPDMLFVDLAPLRERKPSLVLFTDGVDHLVHLADTFTPAVEDPSDAIAKIMGPEDHAENLRKVLGHVVERGWAENKAVDLIGNLLCGTSLGKWEKYLTSLASGKRWDDELYVDDTTVLWYDFATEA